MSISANFSFESSSPELKKRYLCSYCHYLLVQPKFIACGHQFCSLCLEKVIKSKSSVCSVNDCGKVITQEEIYPNIPMESELEHFKDIVCRNQVNGCSWQGNYLSYKDHLQTCQFERFQCECCLTSFAHRLSYEEHYSLCPKALVACPFSQFGCNTQIPRETLRDHVISSSVEHLQMIADILSTIQTESTSTTSQASAGSSSSTATTVVSEKSEIKSLKTELIRLTQINEHLCTEQKSYQSMLTKHERDVNRALVNSQLNKGDICNLEKKIPSLKSYNYNDGTYVWIIENIQDLFHNAKNAPQPLHIASPSFYTSNDGYKLSLKLYLNGDKSVRDTYLSLYVTIRRNDYDSLLEWPFRYPITFCLFDQSTKHDHVVRTLTPDIDSKCFHRPEMDSNVSAGIPEFCPLWKVFSKDFGYVRNDKMYIKTCVDFNIFPAKVWSHWTKLQSCGLPNHIQYIKLKELLDDNEE
ncbi:unnamed protein product [Adineta steineri]|uniref:TNF receptor-associated factor n=1 Tax=Adineta steineri TaxID=433720 RepID=A0A819D5R2_9BILA|nr:unnamed protein product [Adineta steineri]CAF0998606.1 unnamed protein product [Adineta steineri]CAF1155864.1 unnamed protein product [Adineta steineri]CAF1268768.1 unnamed protein product [Adineta steineri]CAF1487182.1 unnamed protein product [Adineta steineri]